MHFYFPSYYLLWHAGQGGGDKKPTTNLPQWVTKQTKLSVLLEDNLKKKIKKNEDTRDSY